MTPLPTALYSQRLPLDWNDGSVCPSACPGCLIAKAAAAEGRLGEAAVRRRAAARARLHGSNKGIRRGRGKAAAGGGAEDKDEENSAESLRCASDGRLGCVPEAARMGTAKKRSVLGPSNANAPPHPALPKVCPLSLGLPFHRLPLSRPVMVI